jgi:hypothetical protein
MPLNPVRHSRPALEIAKACLNELLWDAMGRPAGLPNGMLGMLPVYSIPRVRLLRGQYHHSWRSGWRYFWVPVDADAGAVVEVNRTDDGGAKLGYFSYGRAAVRLATQLERAEAKYQADAIRLRPRILSLGPVQMEALWLNEGGRAGENLFASLLPATNGKGFVQTALDRYRKLGSPPSD